MKEMDAETFNCQLNQDANGEITSAIVSNDCTIMEGSRDRYISNCTFNKKLTLPKAGRFLRFTKCAIDELAFLKNACMKRAVEFEDCQFKNGFFAQEAKIARLCFVNCTFGNGACNKSKLNLNLEAVTIQGGGEVRLLWDNRQLQLTFDAEKCEFGELEFSGGSSGLQAVKMRFERCLFKRSVHLNSISFTSSVEFNGCQFKKYVDCSRAHFSGINFHDSTFNEKTYFEDTCFGDQSGDWAANFSEVTFQKGADFEGTRFRGRVTFQKAVFYEATTFTGVKFCVEPNKDR
ncbi:MAG: hypothetical protein E8D52_03230 [Nitrospira sp.]|nr:MAG: hypothetical protein E8D52_03230 [Nitrospira sp.]